MDTDNKIPVPEPITPIKSEKIDKRPMIIPPHAAATGMYRFKTVRTWFQGQPFMNMLSSLNFFAMSRGDYFEISSQILRQISILPREKCAADHNKHSINQSMHRLSNKRKQISRRRYPISKPTHRYTSSTSSSRITNFLPSTQ